MDSDILVVDDSAAIRKILQRVLRQTGMPINEIHEAGDGQQALDLLKAQKVHLVLSDINMPTMGRLQLLAAPKTSADWAPIPVVMITTEGGEARVAEAVKLGAVGYVRKPFTNVLIVDDSPAMRSFVRRVLELSGIEVDQCMEAGNGVEASKCCRRNGWMSS